MSSLPPLRWGIAGTAAIASKHLIPAMQAASNAMPAAVASRSLDRAQAYAEKNGVPLAYGSYEELLASSEVDAIYLPLPVGMHREWALACAEAGKPCLCEKPLAANSADARAMVEGFAERGVFLAEALMYRYHPMTEKVLELVRSGRIGDLGQMRLTFNVRLEDENDIRFRRETGGGALLDLGVYCVSLARALAGEEPDAVAAVNGFGQEVDENLAGVLRFPSGAVAYLGCSLRHQFDCSYQIMGTRGMIRVLQGGMVAWPGGEFTVEVSTDEGTEAIAIPPADHYVHLVEDVSAAIREGRPSRFPLTEAVANLEVIDRLLASCEGPWSTSSVQT